MGLCASEPERPSAEERQERSISLELERRLKADAVTAQDVRKILFLGSDRQGKSAIFKQISTQYRLPLLEEERKAWTSRIRMHTVQCMKSLCEAPSQFSYPVAALDALCFVKYMGEDATLDQNNLHWFLRLWADPGIQKTFQYRSRFALPESAEYYFEKLSTMAEENWIPSEQDVLRFPVPTHGVRFFSYNFDGNPSLVIDVTGQERTERKKWIHCFENVTCIVFIAAIDEYDMVLEEDSCVSRLTETLSLWEETCRGVWFNKQSILLLFTGTDRFREKIQKVPLNVCPVFANYKGPQTFDAGCEAIDAAFADRKGETYVRKHLASSTDDLGKLISGFAGDIVGRRALGDAGLV